MGKCLSCCEAHHSPQRDSTTQQSKSFHSGLGVGKSNSLLTSDSKASISAVVVSSVSDYTNNKGNLGSGQSMSSDKRMFHPRIPSISRSVITHSPKDTFSCSEAKINQLFDQYKDPDMDSINPEGIEKFCVDLDVKPDDFRILILAWKFNAATMCHFSRTEFVHGCKTLKVDSIRGIQGRFPELLEESLNSPEHFKDLYRFAFRFGLDEGQRSLPTDMAIVLWRLTFSQREPQILQRWLAFLQAHPTVRGILRDTWNMFLNFTEIVGDDLSSYDDTEAWPSLFDDFVEYENDQTNQNIPDKDKEDIV